MSTSRVTAGVPTGGQFAATDHAEPTITLADSTNTDAAALTRAHGNGDHDGPAAAGCSDCSTSVHVEGDTVSVGDQRWRTDPTARPCVRDTVLVRPVTGDAPEVRTVEDVVTGHGVTIVQLLDDPGFDRVNVGGDETTVLRAS